MAGEEQEDSETPSLLKLFKQFGFNTSMHGISRVLTNNSTWKRVEWSVMFLLGVAFSVYQVVLTINDYYSYPVTTEVILQHEIMADFPGFTICNLNSHRKSMIHKEIQDMFETFDKPGGTTTNEIRQRLLNNNTKDGDNQSGHRLSDMLTSCQFNHYPCTKADFTEINTATFGASYRYKFDYSETHEYRTRAGEENGMILELNIEKDEYLPITSKAGVMVIVHPTDEYPFPEDGGILAHPGVVTHIAVKKVVTHRLPAPYSTCVDAGGQGSTQRNLFPNKKYMQTACIKSCYQLELYEKCECCDPDLPCDYYNILNVEKNTTNITVPELTSCELVADVACSAFVKDRFQKGELNCDERCPPSCDRTTFETVVSSAIWPAKSRFNIFLELLNESSTVLQNKSFADNASLELFIRSNFLRVVIYLDSLDFLELTAHAKYDWNLLLGTIGGLLGLWLGFSLLTAMEIVEVLIDTLLYYTRRKHKEKTTRPTQQESDMNVSQRVLDV